MDNLPQGSSEGKNIEARNASKSDNKAAWSQDAFQPGDFSSLAKQSRSATETNTPDQRLVDQLSMANLKTSEEQISLDQRAKNGRNTTVSTIRALAGDVAGVGATLFAGRFAYEGLQAALNTATFAVPKYVLYPAMAIAGVAAGGLVNNAVAGEKLLSPNGFIKDAVATGSVYAAYQGLRWLPANQGLSESTMAKLAENGTVAPGTIWSGYGVSELASIDSNVSRISTSLLNPLNYTPIRIADTAAGQSAWNILGRLQWAGFGGEATASLFANKAMGLAEFNSREIIAKSLGTFAVGYGVGVANKGASILSSELSGSSQYESLGQSLQAMNTIGLETGLATTAVIVPLLAKANLVN